MTSINNQKAAASCPFLNGKFKSEPPATAEKGREKSQVSDSVTLSPFEPADSGPLTKTCVSSAAKATFGILPGFTKAGCPHAA